jgi:hypothetical protein
VDVARELMIRGAPGTAAAGASAPAAKRSKNTFSNPE